MILSPLSAAILATLLMYLLTALGAALVFPLRRFHPSVMNLLMALGAGIMLAASYFSLLAPALTSAHSLRQSPLLMCSGGFLLGGLLVPVGGRAAFTPYAPNAAVRRAPQNRSCADWQHHPAQHSRRPGGRLRVRCFRRPPAERRGAARGCLPSALRCKTSLKGRRSVCRSAATVIPAAVRSYSFGQLSGAVKPLAGILGALLAIRVRAALPLLLSLSGGAMVTVILAELLPECRKIPAAASDGSRDAGGLCPHDGTGYDGDWVITH